MDAIAAGPRIQIETSADSDAYNVGDTMTFTYEVTNTGGRALSGLTLRDAFGNRTSALSTRSLQPGESTTVTVTTEALIDHVPAVTNVPVVSGRASDSRRVQAQGETTVEVSEVLGFVIENPLQAPAPASAPAPAPAPNPAPQAPAPSPGSTATPLAGPVPAAELPRTGTDPLPAAALAAAALILGALLLRRPRPE